jgi:aspartate/methionine/tyrosine aminotransferase
VKSAVCGLPHSALAVRLDGVGFSEIASIRNQIRQRHAQGEQILQFEGGEPFAHTPDHVKEGFRLALEREETRYPPTSGLPALLDALAEKLQRKNGIPARPAEIIAVNGAVQGLFAAFHSIVNPGDDVIVFSPYWTPIRDIVQTAQGRLVRVDIRQARAERLRAVIEQHLSPRTRCIYLNTPHNPTGTVFSREECAIVADVARAHNLFVVSDEAYEDIVFGEEHVSIASLPGMFERTITCFSFSKAYAMTGWRLGYAVAPEPFISGLRSYVLNMTGGVSTPTQWAGLAALESGAAFVESCRAAYRARRDLLVSGLRDLGFDCEMPRGTFFAFPNAARFERDSRELASTLLRRAKLACVPGAFFGPEGEGHLRFSFSTSLETIEEGLEALRRTLAPNRSWPRRSSSRQPTAVPA